MVENYRIMGITRYRLACAIHTSAKCNIHKLSALNFLPYKSSYIFAGIYKCKDFEHLELFE